MVGIIQKIYVINGQEVFFSLKIFATTFEAHYRAYVLDNTAVSLSVVAHVHLFISRPVHVRISHVHELENSFIILPFALCTEC